MYYQGILIGIISFLTIGLFHPIVIKTEYYIGKKAWPVFLIVGVLLTVGALFIPSTFWSAVVSVVAFSSFWSIKELFEQERRVEKGWFPKNPNRKRGITAEQASAEESIMPTAPVQNSKEEKK